MVSSFPQQPFYNAQIPQQRSFPPTATPVEQASWNLPQREENKRRAEARRLAAARQLHIATQEHFNAMADVEQADHLVNEYHEFMQAAADLDAGATDYGENLNSGLSFS